MAELDNWQTVLEKESFLWEKEKLKHEEVEAEDEEEEEDEQKSLQNE